MVDSVQLYELIGAQIRRIREAQSPPMSQGTLAKILGLTRTSVTNIESGNQKPTLDALYRFCEHFHLEIAEIMPKVRDVAQAQAEPRSVVVGGKTQELPVKTAALVKRLLPTTRTRR
jgi:DNA-binding XRE family transcriptional regulator